MKCMFINYFLQAHWAIGLRFAIITSYLFKQLFIQNGET